MSLSWEVRKPTLVVLESPSLGGCVIAGRLAESDQSLQCLIIEAGGDNYNLVEVRTPGYMGKRNPNAFKVYAGNATDVSRSAHPAVCRTILGGGSGVNYMMYTRGNESDFEYWGAEGWGFSDVLPFYN